MPLKIEYVQREPGITKKVCKTYSIADIGFVEGGLKSMENQGFVQLLEEHIFIERDHQVENSLIIESAGPRMHPMEEHNND